MILFKKILTIVLAGILSIVIISGALCFYNILPIHMDNPNGNTDYIWPSNSIWVKATEGISFGMMDANGYNNKDVIDNPDIIILGSSHMEATNVMQNENAGFLLSEKLKGRYSVYNMAISGHHFFKVCQYIPANLELYDSVPKVLIVETSTVNISQENADAVISSSVERATSHSGGIIGILQKVPFFRALYHQVKGGLLDLFLPDNKSTSRIDESSSSEEKPIEDSAYNELFSYLSKLEEKYNTQIVIFYHQTGKLMEDGSICFSKNNDLTAFKSYSHKYGISFIDMTDRFEEMYYQEKHVPHGFCTGALSMGHLNRYGHAAIADELYKEIVGFEEAGELCQ